MACETSGCIEKEFLDGFCVDHWPGYNLCLVCDDYRCEHLIPNEEDLKDPEFISCACGNLGCRTGFVEGSNNRIATQAEFRAMRRSWGEDVPEPTGN